MKRASLLWFVVGLVVAGGASVAINAARRQAADEARRDTACQLPSRLRLYHCPMHPELSSPTSPAELPDLRHEARADGRRRGRGRSGAAVPGRASLTLSPERRQVLGVRSEEIHHGPLDAGDPDRGPRRGRRAPAPPHPHEVRGLRRAPLRRLHGQVREAGRAPALDLQPRAGGDPAGVPAGLPRAEAAGRERDPVAWPRAALDLLEAARQRLLLWDIRPEDIERARADRQGPAHARPVRRASAATWSRRWPSTACGSPPPTRSSTSRTSRTSGCWPTSTSPTCRSVRVGMEARADACPTCPDKTLARRRHLHRARPSRRRPAPIKVRIEVDNAGEQLKPDMFADVFLQRGPRRRACRPGERRDRRRGPQARVRRPGRRALRAARGAARRARSAAASRSSPGSRRASGS